MPLVKTVSALQTDTTWPPGWASTRDSQRWQTVLDIT